MPKERSRRITWAVTLEGIPARWAGAAAQKGAMWYFGEDPSDIMVGYDGYAELLKESLPSGFTQRFDPETGEADLDRFSPQITATPDNLKLFFDKTGQGGVLGTTLGADVPLAGDVIEVTDPRATFAIGDFIYISNETMRVTSAVLASGVWTLAVVRGWGGTLARPHSIGDRVYVSVPYHQRRVVRLHRVDMVQEFSTVVSVCLVETVRTNPQQTVIQINALDVFTALIETKGFARQNQLRFDAGALTYEADGTISGRISADANQGFRNISFVNPNISRIWVRVGDVVARLEKDGRDYVFGPLSKYLSYHSEDSGPVPTDTECREMLVGSGDVSTTQTSFEGIYGGQRNIISMALALMLSQSGDGSNDPEDPDNPGNFLTFDVLGPNVGLGIPASVIDMASWKREIDLQDARISGELIRGDEPFAFSETVVRRMLLVMRRLVIPTSGGLLALKSLRPFSIAAMNDLMNRGHWTWPTPNTTTLNQRNTESVPRIGARVGETPVDDDPDIVSFTIIEEDRRDASNLAQEPRFYDLELQAKAGEDPDAFRRDVVDFLTQLARQKQNLAPLLTLEAPYEHDHPFPGTAGLFTRRPLPDPGDWLRLVTEAPHQLIGPAGERVYPQDAISAFVGRVIAIEQNRQTGNANITLAMENWSANDVLPRVIAPGGQVLVHDILSPATITLASGMPDLQGGVGFTPGDEVWLVQRDGKRHFRDPDGLAVTVVNDTTREVTLNRDIPGMDGSGEGAFLALADPDEYENLTWPTGGSQWFPTSFARRFYAYIADIDGEIGDALQDGPDVWSDPGGFGDVDEGTALFPDQFIAPHTQLLGGDRPVSTHALRALRSEVDNLMSQHYRPCSATVLGDFDTDPTVYLGNRPWASVGGYRSCVVVPFWKNSRLTRVTLARYLRVSNTLLDQDPIEGPPIAVDIRARLLGNTGEYTNSFLLGDWRYLDMSFDLEPPRSTSAWDWLIIEIRSNAEHVIQMGTDPNWYGGPSLVSFRTPAFVKTTAGFYTGSAATPGPAANANEVSATFLTTNDSNEIIATIQGHTFAESTEKMRVWPPMKPNAPDEEVALAQKGAASYVQWGSMQVGEEFDNTFSEGQPGTPDSDLQAYQETRARVARNLSADIVEIVSRRELLAFGPMGWRPQGGEVDGEQWWDDRNFVHPWPTVVGNGVRTAIDRTVVSWNPGLDDMSLRMLVSGLYNTTGQYQEDESYTETADKSVRGWVTFTVRIYQAADEAGAVPALIFDSGDITRQLRYVFTNKGDFAAHHLICAHYSFAKSDLGVGACHDEGLLYLPKGSSPYPADTGLLTLEGNVVTLDLLDTGVNGKLPFRVELDMEVTNGPSGEVAEFLDPDVAETVPRGDFFDPDGPSETVTKGRQAVKLLAWSLYSGV